MHDVFGNSNVGGVLTNSRINVRLLSHTQLRDLCEKSKQEINAEKTAEEQELTKNMFIVWEPTNQEIPKTVWKFKQKNMSSWRCCV